MPQAAIHGFHFDPGTVGYVLTLAEARIFTRPEQQALLAPLLAGPRLLPASVDAANWGAVVEAAGLTGMARQFALNCTPAAFDNRVLRLQFDPAAAHHRTPQNEEKLLQGLSGYLGPDIRVIFEATGAEVLTPARQRAQAEQDRIARAAAAFDEDSAVKGLRERFGAEIDTASVKPPN